MDRAYCIRIYNENETLGNLLAAHLRKYYIEDIKEVQERQINTVGFNKTHPLEKSVLLYINPNKNKSNDWGVLRELIFEMCGRVVNQAKDLIKELQANHLYKSSVSIKKSKK